MLSPITVESTTLRSVTLVLLATDSDALFELVDDVIGDRDTVVRRVRAGADVVPVVIDELPDLVILDMQIGNMGGFATCIDIRHQEASERIPITAVMLLLDRAVDTFLAKRADADGWLIKPLDGFRLSRAVKTLVEGYSYFEGEPDDDTPDEDAPDEEAGVQEPAELAGETVDAG